VEDEDFNSQMWNWGDKLSLRRLVEPSDWRRVSNFSEVLGLV